MNHFKKLRLGLLAGIIGIAAISILSLTPAATVSGTAAVAVKMPMEMPTMKVTGADSGAVRMSGLNIGVIVTGNIATTTMKFIFVNNSDKILEGELRFPMPEGVSISRYAIDINGVMREAVPVEKAKAAEVFEIIEKRRVDPGLLEKTDGNNFRTRIYPLPAHGSRTVIIGYDMELPFADAGNLLYYLPLTYTKPLDSFTVDARVVNTAIKPVVEEAPGQSHITQTRKDWQLNLTEHHFVPNKAIRLRIPKSEAMAETMMEEAGGRYYFFSNMYIRPESHPKALPGSITLLWDASLSGVNRDRDRELALLHDYIQKIENVKIRLVAFSNSILKEQTFDISGGGDRQLLDLIRSIPFDGGTSMSLPDIGKYNSDECLLFSDGQASFGNADLRTDGHAVYTISSSAKADFSALSYWAQKTNGQFINLQHQEQANALNSLLSEPLLYLGIKNNKQVSAVYPSIGKPVINSISVAGISLTANNLITLQFGYKGRVTMEKTVSFDYHKAATDIISVQKLWAQKQINELDLRYDINRETIEKSGKQYGIVTRNTSLLVLETAEDYFRYEITPPAALEKEYNLLVKSAGELTISTQQDILKDARQSARELLGWWNEDPAKNALVRKDVPRATAALFTPPTIVADESAIADRDKAVSTELLSLAEAGKSSGALSPTRSNRQFNVSQGLGSVYSYGDAKTDSQAQQGETEVLSAISLASVELTQDYLLDLKKVKPSDRYVRYLELRKNYLYIPVFYFKTADFFINSGDKITGLKILSNLTELDMQNHEIYKMLGYKLKQLGEYDAEASIFHTIIGWRPYEPQSYRDYGLALADAGRYQEAADTLYAALTRVYRSETMDLYNGIAEVLVSEINELIASHGNAINTVAFDKEILHPMPLDVRVVLNWNMADTDIDLWVIDPHGEKCFYSNKNTAIGGRISNDFTRGYGPEQFMLKKAVKGKYQVKVNYYGDNQAKIAGPTTVMAEIFTHYGSPQQQRKIVALQMSKNDNGEVAVAEFSF